VGPVVVLALVVCKIFLARVPTYIIHTLCYFVTNPKKNLISINRDHCLLTVLIAIPTAIALSQCTGVFGWGWPRSASVWWKIMLSWQLWNKALSWASTTEATTNCKIVVFV
jgi:hypothetical protein